MREKIEPRGDTNRNRLDHGGIAAVVDGQVQDRRTVLELAVERLLPTPDGRASCRSRRVPMERRCLMPDNSRCRHPLSTD